LGQADAAVEESDQHGQVVNELWLKTLLSLHVLVLYYVEGVFVQKEEVVLRKQFHFDFTRLMVPSLF
jgi:hypothetical protein